MQLNIKGKQIDVGDALREHVRGALETTATKYFSNSIDANVTFSREAHMFRSTIVVHVGRGITVQAHADQDAPYASFDAAMEKVAKQLRRYKRRLRDHHKQTHEAQTVPQYIIAPTEDAEPDAVMNGDDHAPVVIAEMETHIQTLSVSEAVMRMDLADLPALLFRNRSHGHLNMIYRRGDGNVGWIDPANSKD